MGTISSRVDVHSEEFRDNERVMSELAADVRRQAARVALGGSAAAVKKHKAAGKLTAREREVLQLAAEGWKEWQIANRLGITDHAIDKHMRSCRQKLDSRNTNHAIAIALRKGLIS